MVILKRWNPSPRVSCLSFRPLSSHVFANNRSTAIKYKHMPHDLTWSSWCDMMWQQRFAPGYLQLSLLLDSWQIQGAVFGWNLSGSCPCGECWPEDWWSPDRQDHTMGNAEQYRILWWHSRHQQQGAGSAQKVPALCQPESLRKLKSGNHVESTVCFHAPKYTVIIKFLQLYVWLSCHSAWQEIYKFVLLQEEGIAKGIRRIVAVTGPVWEFEALYHMAAAQNVRSRSIPRTHKRSIPLIHTPRSTSIPFWRVEIICSFVPYVRITRVAIAHSAIHTRFFWAIAHSHILLYPLVI